MSRCELWRSDWLPGARAWGACPPAAGLGWATRGPFRVFSGPDGIGCTSPRATIAHHRGVVSVIGTVTPGMRALVAPHLVPKKYATGSALDGTLRVVEYDEIKGGARLTKQLRAQALADGVAVAPDGLEAAAAWRNDLALVRVLVVACALWRGERVPGLSEGTNVCRDEAGLCAWAPGCCLCDGAGLGPDREQENLRRERWAA